MPAPRHRSTPLRSIAASIVFFLPTVLALGGCGSIEVALGMRTRLDKQPVTTAVASLSPGPALAPGHSATLVITATTSDGKSLVTVGPGKGKVLFDSFAFVGTNVTVSAKGVVSLPIGPDKLFLATRDLSIQRQIKAAGSKKLVASINTYVVN